MGGKKGVRAVAIIALATPGAKELVRATIVLNGGDVLFEPLKSAPQQVSVRCLLERLSRL